MATNVLHLPLKVRCRDCGKDDGAAPRDAAPDTERPAEPSLRALWRASLLQG